MLKAGALEQGAKILATEEVGVLIIVVALRCEHLIMLSPRTVGRDDTQDDSSAWPKDAASLHQDCQRVRDEAKRRDDQDGSEGVGREWERFSPGSRHPNASSRGQGE